MRTARSGSGRAAGQDLEPLRRIGFFLLLAALFVAPVAGGLPRGAEWGGDAMRAALRIPVLLSALCVAIAWPRAAAAGRIGNGARAALWALFGLTLLSLLVHSRLLTSPVRLFVMLPATLDWLCVALLFTLAFVFAGDPRAVRGMAAALLLGAAWVGADGAWKYVQETLLGGDRSFRTSATFFHYNFAAGFLALCLPVAAARFLGARSALGRAALFFLIALITAVLVTTGSRAGVGAAAAGLVGAFALALLGRLRLPWGRVVLLVLVLAAAGLVFGGSVTRRAASGIAAAAAAPGGGEAGAAAVAPPPAADLFRIGTWRGTWAMARANPGLGTGPGTFERFYPRYAEIAITTHAHSSYLQTAAEQGIPALIVAVLALALALASGVRAVLRRPVDPSPGTPEDADGGPRPPDRLLIAGLCGALLAGLVRNAYDSEWILPGNAFPFWAVAGLLAGGGPAATAAGRSAVSGARTPVRLAAVLGTVTLLGFGLLLFFQRLNYQNAAVEAQLNPGRARPLAQKAVRAWPPDPDALVLRARLGDVPDPARAYEAAARLDPAQQRLYALADFYERQGRREDAIRTYRDALKLDPGSLQTLHALANAYRRKGDRAGALATWRELVRVYESPRGQVVGIGEYPDVEPALAYAALASDAARKGDTRTAARGYAKSAAVLEDYADTEARGQQIEEALADVHNENLFGKRSELRTLYAQVMERRIAVETRRGADTTALTALRRRRDKNLALFDRLIGALTKGVTFPPPRAPSGAPAPRK